MHLKLQMFAYVQKTDQHYDSCILYQSVWLHRLPPFFSQKMTHYEINHATGSSASVSFFGIPYADFDRTGAVT